MNIASNLLTQLKAEFDAQLAAMAKQHRQALLVAFADQLYHNGAAQRTPLKRGQSLLVQAGTWLQQRFFRLQGSYAPEQERSSRLQPNQETITIVEAEYHVIPPHPVQTLNPKQGETAV